MKGRNSQNKKRGEKLVNCAVVFCLAGWSPPLK